MTEQFLLIRQAVAADTGAVMGLLDQLGYALLHPLPDPNDHVEEDRTALVAVSVADPTQPPSGFISLHRFRTYHLAHPVGMITALAVDERHRSHKIGSTLLSAAEAWFIRHDCERVLVTSGNWRVDAHRFYQQHGYTVDGARLTKQLPRTERR